MQVQKDKEKKENLEMEYRALKRDFIGKVMEIKNAKEAGVITAKEAAILLYDFHMSTEELLGKLVAHRILSKNTAGVDGKLYDDIVRRLVKQYQKEYLSKEELERQYQDDDEVEKE